MKEAIQYLKNYHNFSVTENGAVGKRTTLHALLDLNFKVSSLRGYTEEEIIKEFVKAYYEDPVYAVKWLFFLRDILEGLGERRTFRVCMKYLAQSHKDVAMAVLELIPEYGRYDDLLVFLDTGLCRYACRWMRQQLDADLQAMEQEKPVSLLAKWLPSANTSSKMMRSYAHRIIRQFRMTEKEYRRILSKLRAYSNVVEVKLSANRWNEVTYDTVPAKANLKYDTAFYRHDRTRRSEYLRNVILGDEKLNAKGLMPYEIVHRLIDKTYFCRAAKDDILAELLWEKLCRDGFKNDWGFEDCIVVADGSGSMFSAVSRDSSVTAIEVCNSLAIYFADQLRGLFHNKAITFSETPQFIDLNQGRNLKEKMEIMFAHDEVSNTNIEAVFHMLLDMAKSNQVPAEELPKQVLVISDMEFDEATGHAACCGRKNGDRELFSQDLFESIAEEFERSGYPMPRLIFWNVCGRTDTIPMIKNEQGICLLSGFSVNAMKIAADREKKDPYESLIAILDSARYEKVGEAIREIVA